MTTYRGGSNGFRGLSPAEEQLFAAGLAQDEQASVGRPSTYERLRAELLRPASPPPPARAKLPAPTPRPLPRSAGNRLPPARDHALGTATPGRLGEAAKPLVERPQLDSRSKIPGGILESFEEEQRLRKRNDSLRRAFRVVPGGDEALATIEALVETDRGGRRIAEMPSAMRAVDRALEADDGRQRKARIRAEAEKIPMGLEAFESFTKEREVGARNEVLRRALTSVSPPTVGQTSLLSADAEEQLWEATLALEETKAGERPSAYNALVQDERIWNDGLSQDEQASPRGRASEYDRLKNDERIWQDQLAIEEQAANPREFAVPRTILGVPVIVNRDLVDIQLKALREGILSPEEEARVARAPKEEWERARALAFELDGRGASNYTDWYRVYRLSTGEEPPESTVGFRDAVQFALTLASGFGTLDALFPGERNGPVLIDRQSVNDPDALLQLLSQEFESNEEFISAAADLGIRTFYPPSEGGLGTRIEAGLNRIPVAGPYVAGALDAALSPVGIITLIYSGPAALASSAREAGVFEAAVDTLTRMGVPEDTATGIMAGLYPTDAALALIEQWADLPAVTEGDPWVVAPIRLKPAPEASTPTLPAETSGFISGSAGAGFGGGGGGGWTEVPRSPDLRRERRGRHRF